MPGDVVAKIDGKPVTQADVIQKLRGADVPGTKVKLSVQRGKQELEFVLVRAEMRSVMNIKDLYMALGELSVIMRDPGANSYPVEEVGPLFESVNKSVELVLDWMTAAQGQSLAVCADLEDLVRKLHSEAEAGKKPDAGFVEEKKKADAALQAAEAATAAAKKEAEKLKGEMEGMREAGKKEVEALNAKLAELEAGGAKAAGEASAAVQKLKQEAAAAREAAKSAEGAIRQAEDAARAAEGKVKLAEERAAKKVQAAEAAAAAAAEAAQKGGEGKAMSEARRAQVAEEHEKYLKEVVSDLQCKLAKSDFEVGQLKGKVEGAAREVDQAKRELVEARKELRSAVEGENAMTRMVRELEAERDSGARRGPEITYGVLRHENEELRRHVDSLREERRETRETIASQFAEMKVLQDAVAILQSESGEGGARDGRRSVVGAGVGAKKDKGHVGGEVYKLQRELCAAQRMIVALEDEVKRMNMQAGKEGGASALFVRGVESMDLDNKGVLWLNGRTDDIWETLGLAGLTFFLGVAVRDVASPSIGPKATYVLALMCALLFGIFLILTLFKLALAIARGGGGAPKGLQHRQQMVELPEHAPLLTGAMYQHASATQHQQSSRSASGNLKLVSHCLEAAEDEYNAPSDRRSAAVGVAEVAPRRSTGATWTGSSSARGHSGQAYGGGAARAGGQHAVRPGSTRQWERVSALKGTGSYGSVDFSMV